MKSICAQTSYTCYGTGGTIGGTACANDGYYTYALWTKNAKGHKSTVTYDYALGLPLTETDPNNAVTTATYDAFGRFTSLAKPGEATPGLNVSYQNSPFKVTLTQAIDTGLTFTVVRNYDGMGRQTSTVTNGVTTTSTFNAYGKPLTQSMPHTTGAWFYTTTEYDSMGRPITVTPPDGSSTSYAYNGLTTTVTDASNHSTTTVTNILGQTLSVTPPTGPNVVFTYDPLGNLLTATRGGAVTSLTYDKAGRKTSMDDADIGTWNYSYDALGNMVTQTDARGCVTTLQYDVLNRPTNKSYSSCPSSVSTTASVTYTYDVGANGKGRRTSMNDGPGSASWQYDSRGRMIKETKTISGNSFVTEWGYNSADLPTWMKYPDGEIVTTAYDNRMMAVSVTGNDSYVLDVQYDPAGRMTSRALGNGLTQTYTYYPWNQQGGRLKILAAGSLQNMTYAYDSVGNISTITDSINSLTQSFDYDALDRLTSASASGTQAQGAYSETYQYDPATGNLKIKGDLTLNYADADHKHAVTSANGNAYSYDSNGNQTTRNIGSDTFALTYDAENRLTQVKKNGATIATFGYDGDGKRVKSVADGETILFAGAHFELNDTTNQATKYYFAGSARIALRKYVVPQNMTLEYLLGDHLGSTSITADSIGAKISELRYKAWGETRYTWTNAPANTTPTYELVKYQFTGQYSYDVEFGLKYYGARFYDSAVGRFVQADSLVPSGTQGWDRYAYANNSPILYNDPSGHVGCKAGQRCPPPIQQDARDLTQWTAAAAVDIAESIEMSIISQQNSDGGPGGKIAAYLFFVSIVGDGQKYDVKDKIKDRLGETIKLGDQWYEFSTPGNILYGFYGLAAGFTEQELHAGAGYAQWKDYKNDGSEIGDLSTLLDTSDDYYAIEFGFFLYENYYANDGDLTESEFLEALSLFENADKLALKPTPEDPYIPAEDEYETDEFYQ